MLTFDDGPHALSPCTDGNRTWRIATYLHDNGINAHFFIQSHAPGRAQAKLEDPATGEMFYIIKRMSDMGHKIDIHTGTDEDHKEYPDLLAITSGAPEYVSKKAAWEQQLSNQLGEPVTLDGANLLELSLNRAKKFISDVADAGTPGFARPPGFEEGGVGTQIVQSVSACGLELSSNTSKTKEEFRVNAVSGDNGGGNVEANLRAACRQNVKRLIFLFHDPNPTTYLNIGSYLGIIAEELEGDADKEVDYILMN